MINKFITLNEKRVLEIDFRLTAGASKKPQSFQFDWNIRNAVTMHNKLMMIFELLKETGFPSVPERKLDNVSISWNITNVQPTVRC